MIAHRWARPVWHTSLESTNTELLSNPTAGAVVVTDHQLGGYGRRGRAWEMLPGHALAVSCATPAPAAHLWGWVPLVTGMAVVRSLGEVSYPIVAKLKWPNDVLVPAAEPSSGGKIAGILAQAVPETAERGPLVVIGTGLNINQEQHQLPVDTATSWRIARGGEKLPATLPETWLSAYLEQLDLLLTQLDQDPAQVAQDYRDMSLTLGQEVRVHLPGGAQTTGTAADIDASGALVVHGEHGTSVHHAGDVVHLRPR